MIETCSWLVEFNKDVDRADPKSTSFAARSVPRTARGCDGRHHALVKRVQRRSDEGPIALSDLCPCLREDRSTTLTNAYAQTAQPIAGRAHRACRIHPWKLGSRLWR